MYHFQHIEYLWALALLPLMLGLYLLVARWKKKTARKIGDERLVKEITKHHSPARFNLKFLLLVSAFATGAVALANLRLPEGSRTVSRNGIDVLIALDVSRSMLARDIKPDRLERAKLLLNKLIDKLSNDRIGIVIFAGKSYLQMPLTGDHSAAKMYLSAATPDAVPTQGTVVSEALKMCYSAFNAKEKKYKAVVLISDGEDHDEGALPIAGKMADDGIVINTVGIGSPDGSTLVDEQTGEIKKDNEGNIVISKLNEKELMGIAEKGNGIYQLYNNTDEVVNTLNAQLGSMDQREVKEDSLVNYKNLFPYFLAVVLLFLVAEILISERKRIAKAAAAVLPKTAFGTFLLFCFLSVSMHASAQNGNKEEIRKGNDAYEKKEFGNAITSYKKVTDKDPSSTAAQYNLGNALYRDSKTDESIAAYDAAVKSASTAADKAKAYYNKGVVLQNNKKIPECIEAYKNALKLAPEDEDARQNLQKALVQQKQQQQQDKDKKDNKDDKKDQQKKDQQEKKDKQKEKQDQQPQPQPSKISKQDAEEKLKALLQQEKNLHDKMQKMNAASSVRPEKDW